MAKAKRNLAQLRKDNRTSNQIVECSYCGKDALATLPRSVRLTKRHRCSEHLVMKRRTQEQALLDKLARYGIIE